MALEWRLRQVMAARGIWSGAELGRLMEEKAGYRLSPPSISALLADAPRLVKAQTMDALCTALDCTPADLWHHSPSRAPAVQQRLNTNERSTRKRAANGDESRTRRVLPPL